MVAKAMRHADIATTAIYDKRDERKTKTGYTQLSDGLCNPTSRVAKHALSPTVG